MSTTIASTGARRAEPDGPSEKCHADADQAYPAAMISRGQPAQQHRHRDLQQQDQAGADRDKRRVQGELLAVVAQIDGQGGVELPVDDVDDDDRRQQHQQAAVGQHAAPQSGGAWSPSGRPRPAARPQQRGGHRPDQQDDGRR